MLLLLSTSILGVLPAGHFEHSVGAFPLLTADGGVVAGLADAVAAGDELVREASAARCALAAGCPQPAMNAITPAITGVARYVIRT